MIGYLFNLSIILTKNNKIYFYCSFSQDIRPNNIFESCVYQTNFGRTIINFYYTLYVIQFEIKNKFLTLSGGSLGLWVDEERSKLRVDMWTAGHMNIDILNANCGPYWFVSFYRSCMDHTWLRVVRLPNKNCFLLCANAIKVFYIWMFINF